jgi:hypothetical protein
MKFFFGNTSVSSSQRLDYFTMLSALVAIGYVGYVAVKGTRRARKH